MARVPEKLGAAYYRGFLSRQGREFYDRINAQLLQGDWSGRTSFSISEPEVSASDCFAAYKALRDDHPEYFYLGFQCEFTRSGNIGTLRYPILYAPRIIERIRRQMRRSIYRMVRGTAGLPTLEREALVYERLSRRLAYNDHSDVLDHNIVGPVLLSSGVCEGQNALLLLCFRRIGIPCIKVYGKTGTGTWHCWTIAWIDGTPVHCDVTWDGMEEGIVRFDYLNLSDEQISADHFSFKGPRVPVCASEKLGYYQRHGLCAGSFRDLKALLRAGAMNGVSPIRIHFRYHPPAGDYLGEARRALRAAHISGEYRLYCHPALHNLAVKKI